jgi:carbon monoxide dehydrogenase subunit G
MCFSESIVIKVPPAAAFAYLADPTTASVIDPAVLSYEPDSLPLRAGTVNTVRVRLYGIPTTMVSRTVEWEEGRRMVLESIQPARPIRGAATHLFEPHAEGTLYTWSMEMTPTGFGGRVFGRVMTIIMRRNARKQQARFKRVMETGSPA